MFSFCFFISIAYSYCIPTQAVDPNYLGDYALSRYYSVMPDQRRYYLHKTYEQDFKMNCSGDCLVTADGYRLKDEDAFRVVACPKDIKLGSKLRIEGLGIVTCHDRGGAIKGKRLDVWTGIGDKGLTNIWDKPGLKGRRAVYLIQ